MSRTGFFSYESPFYPLHIAINVIFSSCLVVIATVATMIGNSAIQGELALSNTQAVWLTTLNLLGLNIVVPTGNWIANRFGFNRMYACGILVFTFASLLAAVSHDFITIAIARFIEGVGGGMIFPIGLALIAKSVSQPRVGFVINLYFGVAFGVGLGLGIWIAGYLTQFASWRDVFLLIVPGGLLASISCWLSRKKNPELQKSPFDFLGFFSFTALLASLLVALTLAPIRSTPEGWTTPYILTLFGIAFVSFILFIFVESRSKNPLFPPVLFASPIFGISLVALFLLGMATFASVSVIVDYMLIGLHYERFTIGKIASIYGITIGIVSMIANALSQIIPPPLLTLSGLVLLIFSYFLNNELSWLTGYTQVIALLVIRGIGVGLSLGPTTGLALRDVDLPLKSAAATLLTFFRQVGATYGGTLLAIVSIRRTIFHTARFAEQVNPQLPAYKSTLHNLMNKFPEPALAKAAIVNNIINQARIQGSNDAFFVFGCITSVVALILLFLIVYQTWKRRKSSLKRE